MSDFTEVTWACVKWFNAAKGMGFVVSRDLDEDIFIHVRALDTLGLETLKEGAWVRARIVQTSRGLRAQEVLEVRDGCDDAIAKFKDLELLDEGTIRSAPWEPAKVKWFCREKGYGFLDVFETEEDVFVHFDVLQRAGFSVVKTGDALAIRKFRGDRGFAVFDVAPWEGSARHRRKTVRGGSANAVAHGMQRAAQGRHSLENNRM